MTKPQNSKINLAIQCSEYILLMPTDIYPRNKGIKTVKMNNN